MEALNKATSNCRYCRFYQAVGRRGGMCEKFSGPVQGCWKSCNLFEPPFAEATPALQDILQLETALPHSASDPDPLPAGTSASINDFYK